MFWRLVDADAPLHSTFVASAEPYVPWELMVPGRPGDQRRPLGVDYAIGRWVRNDLASPRQNLKIEDAYIIAPAYEGLPELPMADAEAAFVSQAFDGELIRPATVETIEAALSKRGTTLLHFVCHGGVTEGGQALYLDADEVLTELQLEGMPALRAAIHDKQPLVFLNLSGAGALTTAPITPRGLAAAFTGLGARCVVAPLWSITDSVAAAVAEQFYTGIAEQPRRAFADVLREIRLRAYEGDEPEEGYASYRFYGDPLASQESSA